jgi:ketosteroid isomerase-like protein
VITGAPRVAAAYQKRALGRIDSVYTLQSFPADRAERYRYEIGGFTTPSGEYRHLLIRDTDGPQPRRVLELIAPVRPAPSARAAIDRRRAEWIDRCNQHDARALIENLYAPNTVYYNHRPPIVGREALVAAYAYMNNPGYELSLAPLAFTMVNEDLAYEIGQCSGSYGGKYIIAWQRDAAGQWYVLLDSNI